MNAGYDPNMQPASEITHHTQYGVHEDYQWLLTSSPLPPAGSAEMQGTAPNRHHVLPPIATMPPLPEASFNSLQSLIPNCLPLETRCIIREAAEQQVFQPAPRASPEVIFVRSSTTDPCDVVIPPSRPALVASAWSHVTRETNTTGYTQTFWDGVPELHIRDFVESINQALRAPVLNELTTNLEDPNWDDKDGSIERIKNELMVELGRDVSELQTGYANFYLATPLQLHKDNDYPCSNEGFNLSVALIIAALDSGVEDNCGDLEQAGLIPSSWFCLSSAVLGAILRGALRSGGRKIQGRVKIGDNDDDIWRLVEGLTPPVTQGGWIATQAQQITNFFMHYTGSEEPPLSEFYDSILRVGQNHIEKVVRLKAAASYQISVADAQGLADMVYDDMARQTYEHMITNPEARCNANQRARELRESIARMVTDPILDGDEITRARERIRLDHAEEIEAARSDTWAQISSEKKVWAVAYRDSVKLDWLIKAAEELGYVLVSKDDAEEREGRMAKRHAGPFGKRDCLSSRAGHATPSEVPATPENQLRKLDTSQTPKAPLRLV
ncbi:hypothetical protein BJY52DRAFT_1225141 [Lactarius psammicola]|nr:hypothetical protein BJY52DRAFT_1225141 [Lactarius psammicola]